MQDTAPAAPEPVSETPAAPSPQETPDASQESETPKVEASGEKPRSRREAIEAALAKVSEDDKPESKDDRPRGPDGKFLPKEPVEAAEPAKEAPKAPEAPKVAEDKGPLSEPPTRFSADAKAAWKDAPEPVKGEIKRAITELETGLRRYQQVVEPLKPYVDMAAKSGTTVHEALDRYVRMEQALRTDPATGLRALAQNMGMTPADMASILTGQAAQGDQTKDRQIVGLTNKIQQLEAKLGEIGQSVTQTREQAIQEQVASFAKDRPRFDELAPEIARMLQTGYASDLADAYEKADRLNPVPRPAPVASVPTPQPRPALSVTGAPSSGSNPANRQPSATRSEAISRAMQRAGLA